MAGIAGVAGIVFLFQPRHPRAKQPRPLQTQREATMQPTTPPKLADRLLRIFCASDRIEEIQGDLHEEFRYQVQRSGMRQAQWRYWWDVLGFLKPRFISKQQVDTYSKTHVMNATMIRNYFKIAWRNMIRSKVYSGLNIVGLSVGMAVAMLIGFWLWDELSFNKSFENYDRIVQVVSRGTDGKLIGATRSIPMPLAAELRTNFSADFKRIILSSWTEEHIFANGERKFLKLGNYMQPGASEMLSLSMVKGVRDKLTEPTTIMLSERMAENLFGQDDPIGKMIRMNNKMDIKVTGVYRNFPTNSDFYDLDFIAPWSLYIASQDWLKNKDTDWREQSFQLFAELNPRVDAATVSTKIEPILYQHTKAQWKPMLLLHPIRDWHLHSGFLDRDYKVGESEPIGRIQFVWMFGLIGVFVLLLACINFMNLSTARSEKRSKEVGIRKSIGSVKGQLVGQFLSESFLMVIIAFTLALMLVSLSMPWFNTLVDKNMAILWANPVFWGLCLAFILFTGFVAGSYPAFFLSSFEPVKVLKGTFKMGRLATLPRKVLVVTQFTVSVTLIIGTIIVFRQIQYAKNRPVGYDRDRLITIRMNTPDLYGHYDAIRNELLRTGAVANMAESSSPTYYIGSNNSNFDWRGKDPNFIPDFGTLACTHDFGSTIGWQVIQGRDFSRAFSTDSTSMIINEATANVLGFKNPIGERIKWGRRTYQIVGVIRDMVMQSPFAPAKCLVFIMNYEWANLITIKIKPGHDIADALSKIEPVFKKYNPESSFDFKFNDEQYAAKFRSEEQIGQLASFFSVLAIFISCLGIFGLASFTAEQRTKEIGVRKVLGASVLNLWSLLSKDFVTLVLVAFCIAAPLAWYVMSNWLNQYDYRSDVAWWIFAVSGAGALLITLLTVSFQSIKAALMNPVKSLRSE